MLSGEILSTVVQLGLIFLIFYMLLIRPQQQKIKEHEKMLDEIKVGNKVITGGGIYGKVLKVEEDNLIVEIAKDIEVTVTRASVRNVVLDDKKASKSATVKKNKTKK